MIRSLKKAMAPVLSDVSVEWVFPESTEVLVSPVSTSCLFPGDRLVGYGVVCDTSLYLSNPRSVSPPATQRLFFPLFLFLFLQICGHDCLWLAGWEGKQRVSHRGA